jgi:peptidyl-prolyl cis-trans isomerase C
MTDKISAQHILVDHEYEIKDIQKKLSDGDAFEALAKDFSQCGSAKDGGNLGEFTKGMMVAPFEKAAFALEVGEISEPVKTQFGFHLIKRLA